MYEPLLNLSLNDGLDEAIKKRKAILNKLYKILSERDYLLISDINDGRFWKALKMPLDIDSLLLVAKEFK